MMSQSRHWIFGSGCAMRVRDRPHGRVSYGRAVKRKQSVLTEFPIVERSQLHEEVMRMLPINNGAAEGGFSLLEELRIKTLCDCCRLQAHHGAQGQLPR